ncbi:MAG TPA: hypothetical protein VES02_07220 [Dermatophilaceae bacterium]|nr:hypothetical protein [Dermatophilaceae bacterium]
MPGRHSQSVGWSTDRGGSGAAVTGWVGAADSDDTAGGPSVASGDVPLDPHPVRTGIARSDPAPATCHDARPNLVGIVMGVVVVAHAPILAPRARPRRDESTSTSSSGGEPGSASAFTACHPQRRTERVEIVLFLAEALGVEYPRDHRVAGSEWLLGLRKDAVLPAPSGDAVASLTAICAVPTLSAHEVLGQVAAIGRVGEPSGGWVDSPVRTKALPGRRRFPSSVGEPHPPDRMGQRRAARLQRAGWRASR